MDGVCCVEGHEGTYASRQPEIYTNVARDLWRIFSTDLVTADFSMGSNCSYYYYEKYFLVVSIALVALVAELVARGWSTVWNQLSPVR